ncbi:MAG TPA: alpha-glucan family phosphorylase [Candidatus Acidoferrales bacterium]|nr:alpha-glucan family phosphorylase [Candidatus Acidoferrales bacterium]
MDHRESLRSRFPNLPARIVGLERLSYNLWWSWNRSARELFRSLDLQEWLNSSHNPLRMLSIVSQETIEKAARNPEFLDRYDAAIAHFDADVNSQTGWFSSEYGKLQAPIAYFSAEYAFHNSLPLYAGGLGVLAGDYIKECSDLAVPVVAVGLIYSRGYVSQKLRDDGWQEDQEIPLDWTYDPIRPVLDRNNNPLTVQVPLFNPPIHVLVWRADIGRIPVFLLDTDHESNQAADRAIGHRLYTNDSEQRLRQEIVLGIGGMRVLEVLGIQPGAVHINEGHPALSLLQRVRMLVESGKKFQDAVAEVRESSIFTTHTPLTAGTDIFPLPIFEKYFGHAYGEFGTDRDALLQLGVYPPDPNAGFNMTAFALRMTKFCNAVSKKHGEVARQMWSSIWPDKNGEEVPITAITNGVHLLTWMDPIWLQPLLDKYIGPDWVRDQDQPGIWEMVHRIPDADLWRLRRRLKALLIDEINERVRQRWQSKRVRAESVIAFGALLEPEVFTIGFARRFTAYKRPDLILRDLERLKKLLTNPLEPVQIIFAGKAHPSDVEGARIIQRIFHLAQDPEFGARIAFVEDYDQHLAQRMVRGVDLWLNNPVQPLEASGTSGMKASMNGVPNLSILDGWWMEGYNGRNGWAFGGDPVQGDRFALDAESIYRLLEEKIVPLYYRRGDDEIPHGYVQVMKAAIESVAPQFSTRRMVKEYVNRFYLQALGVTAP